MTTVDEILASGRYTDRRGRKWRKFRRCKCWYSTSIWLEATANQMHLLIERDQHRDECPGLALCRNHPVPFVLLWPLPTAIPANTTIGRTLPTHAEALAAARALAVKQ